jgi:hypothetical protein
MSIKEEIDAFLAKQITAFDPETQHADVIHNNDGTFNLSYYTIWHNDYSDELKGLPIFSFIMQKPHCEQILQLEISAEDEGVNGTQNWDLDPIVEHENNLSKLHTLVFPINTEENHNRIIVTYQDYYEENGGIGLLLDKTPNLKKLVIASAPNENFFNREHHPLEVLEIQTGYNHQSFIANLAKANCFPNLKTLHFRDYAERYMEDFADHITPFNDYITLLQSKNLPQLKKITLIDAVLSESEKEELNSIAHDKGILLKFEEIKNLHD